MKKKEKRRRQEKASLAKQEERFKKECMLVAYDLGVTLTEKNGTIFIEKDSNVKELFKPLNPKKMWQEASWAMAEIAPSFKDYLSEFIGFHFPRKPHSD